MPIKRTLVPMLAAAPLAMLVACGGSQSGTNSPTSGKLTVAVTDAPVDNAAKVVVEFTGVSVKPVDGEVVEFLFETPASIDLLSLQGSVSEDLITDAELTTGSYEWIRLHVNAEQDDVMDSYMEMEDGTQVELWIPSGAESGLKLVSGFEIAEDLTTSYTIDFDLRKSIVMAPGDEATGAKLRPALRLVNTEEAGAIEGEVDAMLLAAKCADPSVDTGAVYVFPEGSEPSDVSGDAADPIASAKVDFAGGIYRFEVGFLPEAAYKVAFSCDAATDDPETDEPMEFVGKPERITVTARDKVVVDFIPGEEVPVPTPPNGSEDGKPGMGGKPPVVPPVTPPVGGPGTGEGEEPEDEIEEETEEEEVEEETEEETEEEVSEEVVE